MTYIVPRDEKGRFIGWVNGRPKEVTEKLLKYLVGHIVTKETRDKIRKKLKAKDSSNWNHMRIPKTPELKEKIRLGMLGKQNSQDTQFKKGKLATNWNGFKKGYIPKHKGKELPQMQGENHWNWKGGIGRNKHSLGSFKYRTWRDEVFIRDNYSCQECKIGNGTYLEAHHLKDWAKYPELRYVVSNGITLCKPCHKLLHKQNVSRDWAKRLCRGRL